MWIAKSGGARLDELVRASAPLRIRPWVDWARLQKLAQTISLGAVLWGCSSAPPQTAFYYGSSPPIDDLSRYPRVVVQPDNLRDIASLSRSGVEVFAYVSVGEAEGWRSDSAALPLDLFKGENRPWNSRIPDLRDSRWTSYVLNRRIDELWTAGYRAFFLDTLDSYMLVALTTEERAEQLTALAGLIAEIARRHPGVLLLFNRGFELLPHVGALAAGVVAESLFEGWDESRRIYRSVPESDRQWLIHQLQEVRRLYKLPVTVIDYVSPANPALALATRQRIQALGFAAWVSTPGLDFLPAERP